MTLPSISRALKTVRRTVFAPRDADAGLRLAVTASGCAPWAGLAFCDRCACSGFLFPPQAAVASAAGSSIPVRVTIYARHLLKSKYKEKSTTSNEVVLFGDPYGNRTAEILSKYYNFLYYRRFFLAVMEIFYFMRKKVRYKSEVKKKVLASCCKVNTLYSNE